MAMPYLGETCALLSALNWAFALVLFKRCGESVPPLSLSLFKNVVGIVLLALTLAFVGADFGALLEMHPSDVAILAISGVLGIAIADTLLFYALNVVGVGLVTIVECAYAPSVVVFAWLMLSERMTKADVVGGLLVLSAVFFVSGHRPPEGRTSTQLVVGLAMGALAIVMMAFGIVLAKPIIEESPLVVVSLIRLLAGTLVLAAYMAASRHRKRWFRVFKPTAVWRLSLPASFFGTYVAMLFWVAGFKYAQASVAAILNQTSTIMALVFATLMLKEPFTQRKLIAAIVALGGILVVTLG